MIVNGQIASAVSTESSELATCGLDTRGRLLRRHVEPMSKPRDNALFVRVRRSCASSCRVVRPPYVDGDSSTLAMCSRKRQKTSSLSTHLRPALPSRCRQDMTSRLVAVRHYERILLWRQRCPARSGDEHSPDGANAAATLLRPATAPRFTSPTSRHAPRESCVPLEHAAPWSRCRRHELSDHRGR